MPDLMPHGYTNRTTLDGAVMTKAYQGPDAERRCGREAAALRGLAEHVPVPRLVSADDASLCMSLMPGTHHPGHVDALGELFAGYVLMPSWRARQEAMVTQSRSMLRLCQRWEPGGAGADQWRRRLVLTESWTE